MPKAAEVNMLNPLELLVDKIGLEELVRDNIRIQQRASLTTAHDANSKFESELVIAQLQEFLEWVKTQPDAPVNMYMFPRREPGEPREGSFVVPKHVS